MKNAILAALSLGLISVTVYAATDAVIIDASNVKWTAVPGFAGVQMAAVEGDPAKGPHHSFMKFDAGFKAPMHNHGANHFVSVVSGTLLLTVDGKEHSLPPGSFFSFKNKGMHATACAAGTDCVIFMDVRGKWDVVPAKK